MKCCNKFNTQSYFNRFLLHPPPSTCPPHKLGGSERVKMPTIQKGLISFLICSIFKILHTCGTWAYPPCVQGSEKSTLRIWMKFFNTPWMTVLCGKGFH
jgi:hypothetical protein